MQCFSYQYSLTSEPAIGDQSLRQAVQQHGLAVPVGHEGPEQPIPVYDSKLHMALTYQPEPRMLPFGCMVWYLGKSKDPQAPKSFAPNGKPAVYVGPKVLPGMRCKDIHILLDLHLLTSENKVREIITRDFIPPVGLWYFLLTQVPMFVSAQTRPPITSSN